MTAAACRQWERDADEVGVMRQRRQGRRRAFLDHAELGDRREHEWVRAIQY